MSPGSRPLGRSDIRVSRLALGSWKTFERLSRDQGLAIMRAAREAGITFLDDARYDDDTGHAPIRTGYSEVLFGELFRAAGWRRPETVVSNKLWWEFWPAQSASAELDGSLGRMSFDYVDLIYANPPLNGLTVPDLVRDVGRLVTSGKARAWGIVNWPAALLLEASTAAHEQGVPQPIAAQLPYSLVDRAWVEDAPMPAALAATGAGVVASSVLASGVLSGKYRHGRQRGRVADALDQPRYARAQAIVDQLSALAARMETTPAALAVAFTLLNPAVDSTLFGATSPAQLHENVAGAELAVRLTEEQRAQLLAIGVER
ncbi:MAG: aldo/keto reductase [Chloroflexi bacterium]|nr:aldo/keto reductase [Chloroflexota bacterium]